MFLFIYLFFCLSSEMEYKTLCQMCGRLCFPIILFRVGLLTLIHGFFYSSSHIVPLPAYYMEVGFGCYVASSVLVFKYW